MTTRSPHDKPRGKSRVRITVPKTTHAADASHPPTWIISAALAAATFAVFWPVLTAGFINLDDAVYVTGNPQVLEGLTRESILWAFTNLEAGFWQPLTWLSYLLDTQWFGPRPGAFHFTNLLLHGASTAVLFLALQRMTRAFWRSAIVAALFALHPLHVEPVAWIASRKDVLSTFFWMLALWTYGRYAEIQNPKSEVRNRKTAGFYFLTLLFFVCGLMSKSMVVTLPLVLLLLDVWPLKRISNLKSQISNSPDKKPEIRNEKPGTLILEKLPFFAAATMAGLLTIHAEHGVAAISSFSEVPLGDRLANVVLSSVKYLFQLFWPANLAVFYPYPDSFAFGAVAGSASLLAGITVAVLWFGRRHAYLIVGWFWFVLTLLPVSGIIQIGSHARADRYTYIPLIGLFVLLAWGAGEIFSRWRFPKRIVTAVSAVVLIALGIKAHNQTLVWRDSETLFRHAIAVTRNNDLAYYHLGMALGIRGKTDQAIENYREAIALNPVHARAYNNLGDMLLLQRRPDGAVAAYTKAIELQPRFAEAYNNLGHALSMEERTDEAVVAYRKAIEINPRLAAAYYNLGNTFIAQHDLAAAIANYRRAVELTPNYAAAYNNLANALMEAGKPDEAIENYRRALEINPAFAQAHANFANTLAAQGKLTDAVDHYRAALRLNVQNPKTHVALARTLAQLGQREEALAAVQHALQLNPNYAEAIDLLRTLTGSDTKGSP